MIAATRFEYRFRYLIHTLIYVIGFSAFWTRHYFQIGHNTVWARLAEWLGHGGVDVGTAFRITLVLAIVFAIVGAWLRWWGAAYLGASIVQRGEMAAERVVADGPYRYLRNPLYLGTIFHTLALTLLMQPAGAIFTIVLIVLFQLRLIAREEPYLRQTLGPVYTEYCKQVPRLLPRLRSTLPPGHTQAQWLRGLLGEIYMIGTAVSFAVLGWKYDAGLILQGILVSLGISLVARAF